MSIYSIKKNSKAYTIVELIVVICVIAVLTTIGIISYSYVTSYSRDSRRSVQATLITEALEKYFSENGEYPSCSVMTSTDPSEVTKVLSNLTPDVLTSPTAASGTNSISSCTGEPSTDSFYYLGGGPGGFELKYREEGSNTVKTIASRHTLPAPVPDVSTFPVVTQPPVGSVIAVNPPSTVKCNAGGGPEYHFRYRIDDGAWIEPGAWEPDPADAGYSLTTEQGKKHGLQMQARCKFLNSVGATLDGAESIVYGPVTDIPAAPTVSVNTVGSTSTWSWTAPTGCSAGFTKVYQWRYTISPSGFDSGWYDPTDPAALTTVPGFTTSTEGQTYTLQVKAKCVGAHGSGSWGAAGSASYYRPGTWKYISSRGYNHMCAIASNDQPYCWGSNSAGQLGNNSTTNSLVPTPVLTSGALNGKTVTKIEVGSGHTCAITSDNLLYCWGNNTNGKVGNNSTTNVLIPTLINGGTLAGKLITSVSLSQANHTCAIDSTSKAHCWGDGSYGQLGNNQGTGSGGSYQSLVPVATNGSKNWKQVVTGEQDTCGLDTANLAFCWGMNMSGSVGDGTMVYKKIPTAVSGGRTYNSITAGAGWACAIATTNVVYCWGEGTSGRLGNNDALDNDQSTPVAINVASGVSALYGKTAKSVSGGWTHSCVLATDNNSYCWSHNANGGLGDNTVNTARAAVATVMSGALSGKSITTLTAAYYFTCALANDGNIYCWGRNTNGVQGNGTTTQSLVPTKTNAPY